MGQRMPAGQANLPTKVKPAAADCPVRLGALPVLGCGVPPRPEVLVLPRVEPECKYCV